MDNFFNGQFLQWINDNEGRKLIILNIPVLGISKKDPDAYVTLSGLISDRIV